MVAQPRAHPGGPSASLLGRVLILTCAVLVCLGLTAPILAYDPWWVQTTQETQLWSGPDAKAVAFGSVPQWSYFQVVAPQQGSRLYVLNPLNKSYAYIDASAVGPSAAPPASPSLPTSTIPARVAPATPADFESFWISNFQQTRLWAKPEGEDSLGDVPQFRRFLVVAPQDSDRLRVWSPETRTEGFMDMSVAGPSGPSVWMQPHPTQFVKKVGLPGRSMGNKSYVRVLPLLDDETELQWAPNNTALQIQDEVATPDGTHWYTVPGGGYIRAEEVRLPRPVEKPLEGHWVDADLSEPAMITGYEGDTIVYSALAIKGTAANSTPRGTFQIWRRVADETMDSETLANPIPRWAPGGYYLQNVLYTQYFTYDGASLHYNYWLGTFGYAGSHGCLGLNLEDAKWLWDWADIGTPVVVR